jgi:predicted transcriptional regulator YdeE
MPPKKTVNKECKLSKTDKNVKICYVTYDKKSNDGLDFYLAKAALETELKKPKTTLCLDVLKKSWVVKQLNQKDEDAILILAFHSKTFHIQGFLLGSKLNWQEKKKKTKKSAFEIIALCSSVSRQGIGTELLKQCMKHVSTLSPTVSAIWASVWNSPNTVKFYTASHFKKWKESNDKDVEIWMSLDI